MMSPEAENESLSSERDVRDAVQTIIDRLIVFDFATKQRILRTVSTFFDLATPQARHAETPVPTTRPLREPHFGNDEELNPKDFLFQKEPSTDVDRVACLAYYLTHYRDTPHFKTADISRLNTEAAQMKFSNAAYAVANAMKVGLLVAAGKGQRQLSAMGERYVEALPDTAAAKEVRASMGKKRADNKKKKAKTKAKR